MNIQWNKIRQISNPTPVFKEELRAMLYENATAESRFQFEKIVSTTVIPSSTTVLSFERKTSFVEDIKNLFKDFFAFFYSLHRWMLIAGGGLAVLMMVPMMSVLISEPLSASTKSYIYTLEGSGNIARLSEHLSPSSDQEILENDILSLGNNSFAEILFFEGTSIRIDENTSIEIISITPHDGVFSEGGVKISLLSGRIWVQNFNTPDTESAVEIIAAMAPVIRIAAM